jgi:hypothetical protein
MRASRIEGSAILADAKLRRAALAAANLSAVEGWPSEVDAGLRGRKAPRLEKRLFAALTIAGGDPMALKADARRFMIMTNEQRQTAAIAAGLTYHLSAIGTVIDKQAMTSLLALFGELPLSVALSNAHLAPQPVGSLGVREEGLKRLVEADGWAILDLWAAGQGLASVWRGWNGKAAGGSVSLVASAALAIASAVIRHSSFAEGEA